MREIIIILVRHGLIWIFRTVVKEGADTFGTQDTTVHLGEGDHKFKFQIKDLGWKTSIW